MHPIITIFCAFTRQWAVDKWLENLAAVEHDPALTNLCIIVDGDQHLIANTIKKFAEQRNYRSFHMKINENWHPNETKLSIRRARVAEIHNQSKDLIALTDADIIIGLEDDTVFDRMPSFKRLYQPLLDDEIVGFVEGVQMGRWGANIIGAWDAAEVDAYSNFKEIKTMLPPNDPNQDFGKGPGYQLITGGGWYGFATRRALWLNCDYYTSTAQPWGPDVNFGLWIDSQHYECLVDWQTVFGHNDYNKTVYPDDPKIRLAQVVYNKDELIGKWNRADHEQSRY